MNLARLFSAWFLSRSMLTADLLAMAAQRDRAEALAAAEKRVADRAVIHAQRAQDALAEEQAKNAVLAADFERYSMTGERRG